MRALALALLLAAGCSATEVDVTVDLTSASRAAATHLDVTVTGAETFHKLIAAPSSGFAASERFVYRAAHASGALTFTLQLLDAMNHPLACGSESVALKGGGASALTVAVTPGGTCTPPAGGDMGVGDGGTLDQGVGDMGVVIAPLSCSPDAGFILCDNFEGDLSKWQSGFNGPGANAFVDTAERHSGQKALHFHLDSGRPDMGLDYYWARLRRPFSATGPLFARFYVFIPTASTSMNSNELVLGDSPAAVALASTPYGSDDTETVSYSTFDYRFQQLSSPNHVPVDKWTCLEWEVDPGTLTNDMGTGFSHVWIDGTPQPTLDQNSGVYFPYPAMVTLLLDQEVRPGDAAVDFWIDDFALSNSRIGCP